MQVGFCSRLGLNCICQDCGAEDPEHMNKGPFRIPRAEIRTRRLRQRQLVALGEIPQTDHALHQPHPGRQPLDALWHQCCGAWIFITCLLDLKATSIDHRRENVAITQLNSACTSVVNRYLSSNLPSGSRTNTTRIGANPCTSGPT